MAEGIVFDNKFVNHRLTSVEPGGPLRRTRSRFFSGAPAELIGIKAGGGQERKKQLKPPPSGSPSHR
jgi:hypothetical protein